MKRITKVLVAVMLLATSTVAMAQRRNMDKLDRGLVAVKTTGGVYCSWRINADEYYGVEYNLYRNGTKVNDAPLAVSNYTDAAGTASNTYTVKAVIGGIEQAESKAVTVMVNDYLEIAPKHDASLKSTYVPNDACCADVDGDGVVEILMKFDNTEEINGLFQKEGNGGEYSLFECIKLDGTVLWWVNCGPNMGDFQNNEQNIVGYDWDGDGKAEALMRLAEGSVLHMADGTTYTIGADGKNGTAWTNYRSPKVPGGVEWFTHDGNEFLVYLEGATGKPYQIMDFPLRRLEPGETDLNKAWGDGYGHRSSKYFFGAPYLDGKHPSIFLGRGIYTRHKFVAFDVNPETHELTERWRWTNNKAGSPWYGQGYHNYSIADVDWDGRDEIVWGSMVIDDNGKGLSTTGLGHGDAHHVSDLNPYMHGQEGFFCNEDAPANNYRDMTTSKIYYRMVDTSDAGRSIAGNFSDKYPGSIGWGAHDTPISLVTNDHVSGMGSDGLDQNFRIYWDGDLQEECFNGSSTRNSTGVIHKYGSYGALKTLTGSLTNNDTKSTPCFQGDIFGDWREEVIMRTSNNNIRIYTTTMPTEYRNYSLWYDHQYRNAMVWQMCGYNQPPHASYFLGELENITIAPPPLTTQGREVVENGQSVGTALNGKHVMLDATNDATISIAEGASPSIFTDNAPSWVQGSAPVDATEKDYDIEYTYYTHTLTGAAFTGDMRLVKQGDGILVLPNVTQAYTGSTDVWAGVLEFDGTMEKSHVWLNRFAELNTNGGNFKGGIKADYGSIIRPGKTAVGTMSISTLDLGFGAIVEFDVKDGKCDQINVETLNIEKKTWANGPQYNAPVFMFTSTPESGKYAIAKATTINGDINDIVIEGIQGIKAKLVAEDGTIYLDVAKTRSPESVVWTGEANGNWDLDNTENFNSSSKTFVSGDEVTFNDAAVNTNVVIVDDVAAGNVVFNNNTKNYTLGGKGAIVGDIMLTKSGNGVLSINNVNKYTAGTVISGGTLVPSSLANKDGAEYGALGGAGNSITINNKAVLKVSSNMTSSHPLNIGTGGGVIAVDGSSRLILNGAISGTSQELVKDGTGTLQLDSKANVGSITINGGTVYDFGDNHFTGKTITLNGGTLQCNNSIYDDFSDNVKLVVPEGKTAAFLPDGRCEYTGSLTGSGTLNVTATWVRCQFKGNWSAFTGTITATKGPKVSYEPTFDFNNTYGIPNATLKINSGCTVYTNGKNFAIGALTGTGDIRNDGNWGSSVNILTVGGANTDFTFTGTITKSNVTKVGTGSFTISNTTTMANAGRITINEGAVKLNLATATSSMTGAQALAVNNGGTLYGRGAVANATLNNGGQLIPGNTLTPTSNTGSIKILGKLTANEGSVICLNKNAKDDYNSKGVLQFSSVEADQLVLNGIIRFTYRNTSWTPAEGDEVTLFVAKSISGNPVFELQALPEGLAWDTTSTLMTDGKIRVKAATGINAIPADAVVRCDIYTAAGVKVATLDNVKNSNIASEMKKLGMTVGTYVVRMTNAAATETKKITLNAKR